MKTFIRTCKLFYWDKRAGKLKVNVRADVRRWLEKHEQESLYVDAWGNLMQGNRRFLTP